MADGGIRMADQNHKPQSGDRNLSYVAKQDKPAQERRDQKIKEGGKATDDAAKRDEGIR
jgi:hypothetical protein